MRAQPGYMEYCKLDRRRAATSADRINGIRKATANSHLTVSRMFIIPGRATTEEVGLPSGHSRYQHLQRPLRAPIRQSLPVFYQAPVCGMVMQQGAPN